MGRKHSNKEKTKRVKLRKSEKEDFLKMKKMIVCFFIAMVLICMTVVYASTENQTLTGVNEGEIIEVKQKAERELKEYTELYGNEAYGMTAYVLGKIRIYSIPFCFVGIAVSAIYQYVIGIRRLDVRDKGFGLIIGFVTVLVICQILPLIFALVMRGWRS